MYKRKVKRNWINLKWEISIIEMDILGDGKLLN